MRVAAAVLLLLAAAAPAPGVTITAPGGATHIETLADLQALPPQHLHISFQTGHGPETGDYDGASLWTLLTRLGAIDPRQGRRVVQAVVRVTGRDGWSVALAAAEIAPDFEAKPVVLAWRATGAHLAPGEVRLLVPGDRHGARSVRDVVRISVE